MKVYFPLSSFIRLPVRSMLITFRQLSFSSLLTGVLCAGVVLFFLPAFFSLVTSSWTQDLLTLPYVPSISVLSFTHSIQPPCLICVSHRPDLFCLTETWIKNSTTCTELAQCTPPNYTFLSIPRISSSLFATATTTLFSRPKRSTTLILSSL